MERSEVQKSGIKLIGSGDFRDAQLECRTYDWNAGRIIGIADAWLEQWTHDWNSRYMIGIGRLEWQPRLGTRLHGWKKKIMTTEKANKICRVDRKYQSGHNASGRT